MTEVILLNKRPRKSSVYRSFALFVICFFQQACLPMGMPELYSGDEFSEYSRPRVDLRPAILLVLPNNQDPYNVYHQGPVDSFGYQYLLGVFPFTRLYFEHGEKSFATEVAIRSFEEQGFKTFTVPESHVELAIEHLCPSATLRLSLDQLRINAYDLFLTRRLSVYGEGRMEVWTKYPVFTDSYGVRKTMFPLPFASAEFKRFALAPSLAYRAEIALRESIESLISREKIVRDVVVGNRCRSRRVPPKNSLVVVSRPRLNIAEKLTAAELYESYGFTSLPFSDSSLARVVQRGVETGLIDLGIPAMGATSRRISIPSSEFNVLDATVSKLDLKDDYLDINLIIELSEEGDTLKAKQRLVRSHCRVSKPLDSTLDGAPFFALELGVSEAIKSVMDDKRFKGVDCR